MVSSLERAQVGKGFRVLGTLDVLLSDEASLRMVNIGDNVTLRGHVFVNKGVRVGTGAVVVKDIPEYTIAVGNPAQVLRERS